MPRNSGDSDLYLPLFAGTELARRSGNLTRFPPGNLLGNLPGNGLRVRRVAAEMNGRPPCELPAGELIRFLFYSDFGAITRPEASNWAWSNALNSDWIGGPTYPSGPANNGDLVVFDSSPGTPGNNIHLRQTGQFDHLNYGWLQGLVPVYAGNCKKFLSTFAVRMYSNSGSSNGSYVQQNWLYGPAAIHDETRHLGTSPGTNEGVVGAFGVTLNRSFNALVISPDGGAPGFGTSIPGVFSGTNGDSRYIEVYQTVDGVAGTINLRVDVEGVTRYNQTSTGFDNFRSMPGWMVLYPFLSIGDSAYNGATPGATGNTHALYTNTWALSTLA